MDVNKTTEQAKEYFLYKVSEITAIDNFSGTALYRFITCFLNKWKLGHLDPYSDILLEAVSRGLDSIEKGISIEKPESWLRGTCLNIMRDKVKESIKTENHVKEFANSFDISNNSHTPIGLAEFSERLEVLDEAILKLSEDDREIIHLHFFENKSYSEIRHYFETKDGKFYQESALRKRQSRALERLKIAFLKLYTV